MAYRITLRRDTSTNWTTNNPVLLLGEPGFETDTSRMKIGDGSSLWNDLPYYVGYDLLALDSDLIPATGGTYDLGATAGYSWRDLYLSGNTIYLGDARLSAIGSSVSMESIVIGGSTGEGGVILSATGGYLTSDGTPVVGPTGPTGPGSEFLDRLINGDLEVILDSSGTLNTPLLLPTGFTAICDESHMIDPVVFEGTDWWEFQVQFQVNPNGTVQTLIDNIFPIPTNPGYDSGYTFRFTEEDHGIPNFIFDITLDDVVLPGGAGWTANLSVTQPPSYPSTIESLGAIKITSDTNSLTLGTDGSIGLPELIVDLHNGGEQNAQTLRFADESTQAVITIKSPFPGDSAQRIIIQGAEATENGEGGDVYLWGGNSDSNGGDIKIYAGDAGITGYGGYVNIAGGDGVQYGGNVTINGGYGSQYGGNVTISAASSVNEAGDIILSAGYGDSGNHGITRITTANSNNWIFGIDGEITLPSGGDILDINGRSVINIIEVTYSELTGLVDGSSLIPGHHYIITDFKNCYDQPDYKIDGSGVTGGTYKEEAEGSPIIVFAISLNELASEAFQPAYPKDTIKYDITFNQTEVTGGPAFGRITERIDEWGNRTDYDHRSILFRRYDNFYYEETDLAEGTIELLETGEVIGTDTLFNSYVTGQFIAIPTSPEIFFEIVSIESNTSMFITGLTIPIVSPGANFYAAQRNGLTYKQNNISATYSEVPTFLFDVETIIGNYLGDVASLREWNQYEFILPNNVFGEDVISNRIGNGFRNNTFQRDVEENVIGDYFRNNTIFNDADFTDNQIGNNFSDNMFICAGFNDNVIGDGFQNNLIFNESTFLDNQIGVNFSSNFIYSDFDDNNIGNGFTSNEIYNGFYSNHIGNGFQQNVLSVQFGPFSDNEIGNNFKGNLSSGNFEDNSIGNDFLANEIGNNFSNNTIGNQFIINDAGNDFTNNFILNNFSNNQIINNFQYNYVGNDFINNIIGYYFQYNRIETGLNGYDFTEYLGRLFGGSIPTGTPGSDGVYTGISQLSTTGIGTGAIFTITVSGDVITDIDATYSGKLYQAGDTITISALSFGGGSDLVMTDLNFLPDGMVYGNYNKTIQRRFDGTPLLVALNDISGWYITEYITQPID